MRSIAHHLLRTALAAVVLTSLIVGGAGPVAAADPIDDVNSLGLEASYDVSASFDLQSRRVAVATTATVRGSRPWSTSRLAFNLSTLRTGDARLTVVTVDDAPVEAAAQDQTVIVPLEPPLAPGESRVVVIEYEAQLNANPDRSSDEWGFARTDTYLTAYRWIPWLTRTTSFDRPSVGDPFVTASSPSVRVAITTDRSLVFAATGEQTSADGATRVFEARNVRDFNFSASASYRLATRTVGATEIRLLYRRLVPDAVLDITERAFRWFSDRVGPYPYDVLTIGEVGPWAALESPMLFWLPENAPRRLLPWMTAHETGHQWFYAVVGNDQAREPFADEALTDFISRDLISRFVQSQCPQGFLDASIYDLGECYPWVVYVQGDRYLLDYRAEAGPGPFWRGVAGYYAEHRFGMGGTRQLLDALDRASGRPRVHRRFPGLYPIPVPCLPMMRPS